MAMLQHFVLLQLSRLTKRLFSCAISVPIPSHYGGYKTRFLQIASKPDSIFLIHVKNIIFRRDIKVTNLKGLAQIENCKLGTFLLSWIFIVSRITCYIIVVCLVQAGGLRSHTLYICYHNMVVSTSSKDFGWFQINLSRYVLIFCFQKAKRTPSVWYRRIYKWFLKQKLFNLY